MSWSAFSWCRQSALTLFLFLTLFLGLAGALALAGIGSVALAADAGAASSPERGEAIRDRLRELRPDLDIISVAEAPVADMYSLVLSNGARLYVTGDGQHLFAGELYRIGEDDLINLSEAERAAERTQKIEALGDEHFISFMPDGETRTTLKIFTDVDCGYCRVLHEEVPELNAAGIAVRYLAYPRSGPGTESYTKAVTAWCSDDPQDSITRLKAGESLSPIDCDNPVLEHYDLARTVGASGTPFIMLDNGMTIPGYVPAPQLIQRLEGMGVL